MEQAKSKNGIIILLVILLIILAVLCVLFATGKINLKSIEINQQANENGQTNSNSNQNNSNKNIDDETLSKLLPIIGLKDIDNSRSICNTITQNYLNSTDSRLDSYNKDDAYWLVLSYYQLYYNQKSVDISKCLDPSTPVPASGCYSFSKNTIKEVINKYDLKYTENELFNDNKQDTDNYYATYGASGVCAGIIENTHSISSWYGYDTDRDNNVTNKDFVTIRDVITIKYDKNPYDDITSRVIYYTFKLYDGNYKLWLYRIN